ncbi:integrase [Streptomyces sp. NPDC003300]|uniref:integrase n=1 Tax=unclassified Streptomyces TaxID=2593676 RepID=UPI0033A17864
MEVRTAPRGALLRGDRVRWRGAQYVVADLDGVKVVLAAPTTGEDAPVVTVLLTVLAAAEDFAMLDVGGRPLVNGELPNFAMMEGIPRDAAEAARRWEQAVVEVDTGLALGAAPGSVPRPAFDPATTTLIERYQAKAAELRAVLGWSVSWQTVQAKRLKYCKQRTALSLVDGRSTKARRQFGLTDPRVVDALMALVQRQQQRLDTPSDARKMFKQLRRLVRATHGHGVKVPAEPTLYKLLQRLGVDARDLSGSSGRGRRLRTGGGAVPPYSVTTATMPGELVQIDSTDLDVWVLGDDGRPARVELTGAVCVATRSIVAAVLRPKQPQQRKEPGKASGGGLVRGRRRKGRATKAVDACEVLAQALVPAAMRPGFDQAVHASFSDLPYEELVAVDPRFAHAAARPVIIPDLVVIDHGKVFAGRTFRDACAYLGISLRTARKGVGSDKAIVERAFLSIKSGFSQYVNSYTGNRPMRMRTSVDGKQLWTLAELDDLLQQWIALEWQNKPHPELVDPFDAYMPELTPNQMYAACVAAEGYVPIPLTEDDYLRLLPTAWVGVSEQGIRFKNRTYDHPSRDPEQGLNPYRRKPSGLQGKKHNGWELRYSPNDLSRVWLRDHHTNKFVEAPWVHQRLVEVPFTQFLWDIAVSQHLERGGDIGNDEAIGHALADLLERAARGPDRSGPVTVPDGYRPHPAPAPVPQFDPYAGLDVEELLAAGEAVLPDDDLLELDDVGFYWRTSAAVNVDWAQPPRPPDAALQDQKAPQPGAVDVPAADEDLDARYRRIIEELDQQQDDADDDPDFL